MENTETFIGTTSPLVKLHYKSRITARLNLVGSIMYPD